MELAYAILADAAQTTPDNKVSIIGGDVDTVNASVFPIQLSNLAIIIRLNVEPAECEISHNLHIALIGPLGSTEIIPIQHEFIPRVPPEHRDQQLRSLFVINLPGLQFQSEGTYRFQIKVDNRKLGEARLHLVRVVTQS